MALALLRVAFVAAGLVAGAALGQNLAAIRVNEVLGMAVTDRAGAELGEVKELMLDLQRGRVHYAVLELPALGMGEKQFAYPVTALAVGKTRDRLVLNIARGDIEGWEGFERSRWPAGTDEYWSRIERRYGGHETGPEMAALDPRVPARTQAERKAGSQDPATTASAGQSESQELLRATHLLGMEVLDPRGLARGTVVDMVLSLREARLRYLVLEPEGSARSLRVPIERVVPEPQGRTLLLKAEPKRPR